jgi:hypothetical protein
MKPTLFLSHAAKDSRSIGFLKDRIVSLTGSSIDIFVSSDGESIRFGRNWVHQVEEALGRAKLMFVFLSPAALQSRWVPFESGFAYAKGIQVVPVGILGVDLASVGPPFGLLQGFNINSPQALNNLVKIINDTFECSFGEEMTAEDYQQAFLGDEIRANSLFGEYSGVIDEITFHTKCIHPPEDGAVIGFLEEKCLEFRKDRRIVYLSGLSFQEGSLDCRIDPLLSALTFRTLEQLIPFIEGADFQGSYRFSVHCAAPVVATEEIHKLSARIYGSDFKLDNDGRIILGALKIKVRQKYEITGSSEIAPPIGPRTIITHKKTSGVEINALYEDARLSQAPVCKALSTLFQVGVLFLEPS